ncbi:protein of unknown function [Candidatus Filomicrobium marinum]|uniref:Uncharacterized protein n=1 Tax=Candidatus Filomicrobium marinum TaxID=1608628 RepID=A0A0D6JIU8_9HYPH|nr:hypothetical protein [Candidatus Filomicrobium marinum]CFX38775.1 protein of unknown function [Candidatus Filomicrobium marinum]CPR21475.1 protein of unknown function [Candidatus Filomicrobium marinum]
MPFSSFETVSITAHRDGLPAHIEQRVCNTAALAQLFFLLPVLGLFAAPYLVLGVGFVSEPIFSEVVAERPSAFLAVLAGFGMGGILLGLPTVRCLRRLGKRREITLTNSYVEVDDRNLWGASKWGCPLREFSGVTHHIRTNVSGVRHELILVHPVSRRCLLLRIGDQISLEDTQSLADLLGLPMLSASALFARRSPQGTSSGDFAGQHRSIEISEGIRCP